MKRPSRRKRKGLGAGTPRPLRQPTATKPRRPEDVSTNPLTRRALDALRGFAPTLAREGLRLAAWFVVAWVRDD